MSAKTVYQPLGGGIDTVSSPMRVNSGRTVLAVNYHSLLEGGYETVSGYEALPNISGVGAILGVGYYQGRVYAVRQDATANTANLWAFDGAVWLLIGSGLALGKHTLTTGNFKAQAQFEVLIGVCDNGKPYLYDKTSSRFAVIEAAMTGARYACVHRNFLFLGFASGSVQWSSLGNPELFDAATGGAGELGTGDTVTGLLSHKGILIIGGAKSVNFLKGNSNTDFSITAALTSTGIREFSLVEMASEPYFAHARGMVAMGASQLLGDFVYRQYGMDVSNLFTQDWVSPIGVLADRNRNQYRLYLSDGSALYGTISPDQAAPIAFTKFIPPSKISCVCSGDSFSGGYVSFAGLESGEVVQLDKGTSFNGEPIESILVTANNYLRSPQVLKRFHRAWVEVASGVVADGSMLVAYELDLGNSEIDAASVNIIEQKIKGGRFDLATFDGISWSSPTVNDAQIDVSGIAKSIALSFYSKSATQLPSIINGYTVSFTPRRIMNGG